MVRPVTGVAYLGDAREFRDNAKCGHHSQAQARY